MAVISSSPAPGRVGPAAALVSASGRAPTMGLALLSAGAVCATALLDPAANPFALVTLPAAVALVLLVFLSAVRRGQPPDLARAARSPATKIVVTAWLSFALVRLVAVLMGHASP